MRIKLDPTKKELIRKKRKENEYTAEDLSERINKSKSWVAQLERGRFATVKKEDLAKLLKILDGYNDDFDTEHIIKLFSDEADAQNNISWFNHEFFSIYNTIPGNIDLLDRIKELVYELANKVITTSNSTESIKKQFVILQTLNILKRNLDYSAELTSMLNCIQLYALEKEEIHKKHQIRKNILKLFETLHELFRQQNGSYIIYSHGGNLHFYYDSLVFLLDKIKDAYTLLFLLLSPNDNASATVAEYNKLITFINETCSQNYFSDIRLNPIDPNKNYALEITEKNLAELQLLLNELNKTKLELEIRIASDELEYEKRETLEMKYANEIAEIRALNEPEI